MAKISFFFVFSLNFFVIELDLFFIFIPCALDIEVPVGVDYLSTNTSKVSSSTVFLVIDKLPLTSNI